MKKVFTKTGIVVLIIFVSFEIAYAYSGTYGAVFGGKITNTKATKIEELENNGYQCDVNGTSISVRPIKGPDSFVIPSGTNSRTGTIPASGQWILGKYSGQTTITCTKQCGETTCTDTVSLDTITMFGTSKR